MHRARNLLLVLVVIFALPGCAADRTFGASPNISVTDLTSLPRPAHNASYVISPLETVEIRVLQDASLTGLYIVDADGTIPFPLIGNIEAAGLGATQLANEISRRLDGRFVQKPDVIVRPTEAPPPSISVGGEVNKPGMYPVSTANTLLRAINQSGGRARYAKLDDVLIFRKVDGQNYIGLYDLGAIERGNYADPELIVDDIIMVGDSPSRRRFETILQVLPLLSTSAILVDRVSN